MQERCKELCTQATADEHAGQVDSQALTRRHSGGHSGAHQRRQSHPAYTCAACPDSCAQPLAIMIPRPSNHKSQLPKALRRLPRSKACTQAQAANQAAAAAMRRQGRTIFHRLYFVHFIISRSVLGQQ